LFAQQSKCQTDGAAQIDGNYAHWIGELPPNISAFKIADSLLRADDSLQVLKITIGGDHNLSIKFERFYYADKEWKYDSNQNIIHHITSDQSGDLSSLFENRSLNEHETYIKVKDLNGTTSIQTIFYLIVYRGKIIKSLTSSIPYSDISKHIYEDDKIFSLFNEKK